MVAHQKTALLPAPLFRSQVFTENSDCFRQALLLQHLQVTLDCSCRAPEALPMSLSRLDDEPGREVEQMHNELVRVLCRNAERLQRIVREMFWVA